MDATIIRSYQTELFKRFLRSMYAAHVSLAAGRPWSCDIVDLIVFRVFLFRFCESTVSTIMIIL